MKIKRIGWNCFLISSSDISLVTDPLDLLQSGVLFPKTKTDIVLFSNNEENTSESLIKETKLDNKIVPDSREMIMEVFTPGEYEIGGLMIRRNIGENFYIIDEKNIRVLYLGGTDNTFNPDMVKNVGDVDVLILPVGDGVKFMNFEKLEKVISNVDPFIILPCAYREEKSKFEGIKGKDEFIKYFGFATVSENTVLNVAKKKVEEDQQSVEVIFLK